jgi:hypothetical protein
MEVVREIERRWPRVAAAVLAGDKMREDFFSGQSPARESGFVPSLDIAQLHL